MSELTIGVLGFQGDIEEHVSSTMAALEKMGLRGEVVAVKGPEVVEALDGLIIPGGESTVMGSLSTFSKSLSAIGERLRHGMPAMGTCAGVIVLAKRAEDRVVGETHQPLIGTLDADVERNSFGRQADSFEVDLEIPIVGGDRFRGVFIRAPSIRSVGPGVEVLSKLDGQIVAVRQGRILGLTFHPELAGDTRLHEYFLGMASKAGALRPARERAQRASNAG